MSIDENFEAAPAALPHEQLILDLGGYEGPLDVLLDLARLQKVDLVRISILNLAEQYLAFIQSARDLRLEIAADYLVMAAWLAYLKSRLLLPQQSADEEEPSGAEMAAALRFQLQRLEAMREAGVRLLARPQLGIDCHRRGEPERPEIVKKPYFELSLYDLLRAYGDHHKRQSATTLHIAPTKLYSMDDALGRLREMLGRIPEWQTLMNFLPADLRGALVLRSAVASTFAASLELTRSGRVQMRQDRPFGPIYVRARRDGGPEAVTTETREEK
ncbi:MAG TPA: ScpA family protein [Alphaproteobacteria bacterium]|nr:ScpA family protein [Alphaproteobacteria bacterium]